MSMDYYLYLKETTVFSSQTFESYCGSLGLHIELHPAFNLVENSGFLPIRLIDERFAEAGGSHDFLSGFELYSSEYRHIFQPQKQAPGFFQKLFKIKPVRETPFDSAVKDSTRLIEIHCSSADSFEVLLAYIFGAYLVKHCGGVFDDPQTGQFYADTDHLENEIAVIIEELLEEGNTGKLLTHEFKEWI